MNAMGYSVDMATDLPLMYSPTHPTMVRRSEPFVTHLYNDTEYFGEVVLSPQSTDNYLAHVFGKELRFSSFSPSSERCLPLLVLHTISVGVWFKLAPSSDQLAKDVHLLNSLHMSCLNENKTAVAPLDGGRELHLVAMPPSPEQIQEGKGASCFWGFVANEGMYGSCLTMLNLRCLAMVLDLDETLIVANTSKTFDDRIDALSRRLINREDPALMASLKRFQEDKAILEQYIKTDQVFDSGKLYKAQSEVVPPVAEGAMPIIRPIVRLLERNLILTRINPAVRDTSVLVRLRPNWDELKSYFVAKGRKRFEVFICTMSERDYALEMWRLLDPEAQLINPRELNERVTCVKSDSKKSLKDVFPRRCYHPKMAMVIDDRLPVWEKVDQPRVHEVQAFMPYTEPKAETIRDLPPLFIARNIACNVRGHFFKELDENLTQQMVDVNFHTDVTTLPKAPDVSNYIFPEVVQEEVASNISMNGVKYAGDGMANAEVEMSLKPQGANGLAHARSFTHDEDLRLSLRPPAQQPAPQSQLLVPTPTLRPRPQFSLDVPQAEFPAYLQGENNGYPPTAETAQYSLPVTSGQRHLGIQGSPAREEGEVPETDIDPDTRRRLLILQHGMDNASGRKEPAVQHPPLQLQIPMGMSPAGGWLGLGEEMSPRRPTRGSPELLLEPESPSFESRQTLQGPPGFENPFVREQQLLRYMRRQQLQEEVPFGEHRPRFGSSSISDEEELSSNLGCGGSRERTYGPARGVSPAVNAISALHEIGQKVKRSIHYRTRPAAPSGFIAEITFGVEKVGEALGRTKKEAKYNAAESSLRFLANKASRGLTTAPPSPPYASHSPLYTGIGTAPPSPPYSGSVEEVRMPRGSRDPRLSAGIGPLPVDDDIPIASTSGHVPFDEYRSSLPEPTKLNPVTSLKELCTMEAINVQFKALPSSGLGPRRAFHCQVEVGGRTLGKGTGLTWDDAKHQAADEALRQVQLSLRSHKRGSLPRSPPGQACKRLRAGEVLKDRGLSSSLSPVRGGRPRLSPRRHPKNLSSIP